MKLKRYVEALQDPTSGLTYPSLTGAHKQSVVDTKRLFGSALWMIKDTNLRLVQSVIEEHQINKV